MPLLYSHSLYQQLIAIILSLPAMPGAGTLDVWGAFYDEMVRMLEEADRQYGVASLNYTQYVIECLETVIQTIRTLSHWKTPLVPTRV